MAEIDRRFHWMPRLHLRGCRIGRGATLSVLLACLLLTLLKASVSSTAHPSPYHQADGTVIAYVSSSTTSQEIRTINPDGTGDALLWGVPNETHPVDGIALGGLSWHPDATELAFDSGHDWQRSMNIRDLYSVTPNGQVLRRVSRPPSPEANGQFSSGTVKFTLDMLEQGDVQLYIEGMDAPYEYFARINDSWTFTFTLADFGENHRQYMRVWDPDSLQPACNFSEEGWVDVVPNTVTDIGTIRFSIVSDHTCPVLFAPSWNHDGSALNYIFREADQVAPENNLWQIPADANLGTVGTRLLNLHNYVFRGAPYRIVGGPTQSTADTLYFLETDGHSSVVFQTTVSNPENHTSLNLGLCPEITCTIHDIEWLQDGAGFVFSRYETSFNSTSSAIYRHDIASGQFAEIVRLPNEAIGNLSISPDGSTIVFERSAQIFEGVDRVRYGPRVQCPCALWLVESDGSDLRLLTEDGRQPAWSPLAPQTIVQPTATVAPTLLPTLLPTLVPPSTPTPIPPTPVGSTPELNPALWLPYIN